LVWCLGANDGLRPLTRVRSNPSYGSLVVECYGENRVSVFWLSFL
jgi:hypothetical protein